MNDKLCTALLIILQTWMALNKLLAGQPRLAIYWTAANAIVISLSGVK